MACWSDGRKVGFCYALLLFSLFGMRSAGAAENLNQIIAAAKNEPELNFIAGAQAFGGSKAFADIEAVFNNRFGLNMRIRFTAGPEMNAMAARVMTELKSGARSSTDVYHGSQSHVSLLHKEKALEQINKVIYFLQQILNKKLKIHPVPKMFFVIDQTEERAIEVEKLIEKVKEEIAA